MNANGLQIKDRRWHSITGPWPYRKRLVFLSIVQVESRMEAPAIIKVAARRLLIGEMRASGAGSHSWTLLGGGMRIRRKQWPLKVKVESLKPVDVAVSLIVVTTAT